MRHCVGKFAVLGLGLVILAWTMAQTSARAAGEERALGDVGITAIRGCTEIRVGFNMPVLYLRHFPQAAGHEALIFLHFPGTDAREPSFGLQQETASIPPDEFPSLTDVVFEGDAPGGPYLSLRFAQEQSFAVRQGEDFRSISVFIPQPGWSEPCPPDP